jgi:ATP-dependent Clp protease ATP-binding subunit ClpA
VIDEFFHLFSNISFYNQEECISAADITLTELVDLLLLNTDPGFSIFSLLMLNNHCEIGFFKTYSKPRKDNSRITSNIFLIQHISEKLFDFLFLENKEYKYRAETDELFSKKTKYIKSFDLMSPFVLEKLIEEDFKNDYSYIEEVFQEPLLDSASSFSPILRWFKENVSSFKDQLIKITKSKLKKTLKFKDLALENQCFKLGSELEEREFLIQKDLSYLMQGEEENVSRKKVVNEEDIVEVLGLVVDVPVTKVTEDESIKLLNIEETLHRRVIGQHEAVSVIARALRRSRVGLRNTNRPIASFLFAGPTGVGKTEIVKTLAKSYFGSSDSLIVFDMSEYMERHSVSRLVGASPGYVGYEEGGLLTEAVRKKPYSIVLFDEIEKAHQDVYNLMLQIFEEGQLTDSKGRKTDFGNTLIVLTSNVGSDQVAQASENFELKLKLKQGKGSTSLSSPYERVKRVVVDEIKGKFRPEFLNRLDEIVVLKRLTKDEVGEIAEIMLRDVFQQVYLQGIKLAVTNRFKAHLIDQGYDPVYGARPLRRVITTLVLDNLAQEMLLENIKTGDTVILDIGIDNKIKICKSK